MKTRSVWQMIRSLGPLFEPYGSTLAFSFIVLLMASAVQLAIPSALRLLIDALASKDPQTIDLYFEVFILTIILFGALSAVRYYLVVFLGERIGGDLRTSIYDRLIALDPSFFEINKTGEVTSRLTNDVSLVQNVIGGGASIGLRAFLLFGGALIGMLMTSVRLTVMVVGVLFFVLAPLIATGSFVRKLTRASLDAVANTNAQADESLGAVQTVQAFTLEDLHRTRYRSAVVASVAVAKRRVRLQAVQSGLSLALLIGGLTIILWIGTSDMLSGKITLGDLGQFFLFASYVGISGASLTSVLTELQRAAGILDRLMELMHAEPIVRSPPSPVQLTMPVRGCIEFDDVSFAYPSRPATNALTKFSLCVEQGETVALVGPSGAGKSTVFQLLLRFYDPSAGSIALDGIDVSQLDLKILRSNIGLVSQESVLFGVSVEENIRWGRLSSTRAEIGEAARAAEADEFIRTLPQDYGTFIGEHGSRLSGGQRQRIAIARAVLKNAPVLLLDEATSALDAESESLIQRSLQGLMRDRSTIIIAHRLSTVLKANRIVVLDHGRIVGIGTHNELMLSNDLYARLATMQLLKETRHAQSGVSAREF